MFSDTEFNVCWALWYMGVGWDEMKGTLHSHHKNHHKNQSHFSLIKKDNGVSHSNVRWIAVATSQNSIVVGWLPKKKAKQSGIEQESVCLPYGRMPYRLAKLADTSKKPEGVAWRQSWTSLIRSRATQRRNSTWWYTTRDTAEGLS